MYQSRYRTAPWTAGCGRRSDPKGCRRLLLESDSHLVGAHYGGLARSIIDLTHLIRVATAAPLIYVVRVGAGAAAGAGGCVNFRAVTFNKDVCAGSRSRPI